jgi:hypothetical protein
MTVNLKGMRFGRLETKPMEQFESKGAPEIRGRRHRGKSLSRECLGAQVGVESAQLEIRKLLILFNVCCEKRRNNEYPCHAIAAQTQLESFRQHSRALRRDSALA